MCGTVVDPLAGVDLRNREESEIYLARLEASMIVLAADIEGGRVPPNARRGLFPHEVAAGVDFIALAGGIDSGTGEVTRILSVSRGAFLDALRADLASQPNADAVVVRLLRIRASGPLDVAGAAEIITASESRILAAMTSVATTAADGVVAEGDFQRTSVTRLSPSDFGDAFDAQAARLAVEPQIDALRAVTDAAVANAGRDVTTQAIIETVDQAGRALSEKSLQTYAKSVASSATTLGRQTQADLSPGISQIYASELIESPTICGPCSLVDGKEYSDRAAAKVDYPSGTYYRCEGGLLCRGVVVYVFGETPANA